MVLRRYAQLVTLLLAIGAGQTAVAQAGLDESLRVLSQSLARDLQTRPGVRKLAAFDFVDIRGYRSALDAFIAEELVTQIMATAPGAFTFVERRQLGRIIEEQNLTASEVFDQKTLADVGRLLGVQAIITGSISDLGTQVRLNARAIAIDTGEVFASASASVTKDGPVAELLRQSGRLDDAGGLSETGSQNGANRRPVQASDVFFENKLISLTVGGIGVSQDRQRVTLSLVLENRSDSDLLLAVPTANASGGCGIAISDERGNMLRVRRFDLAGIPCIYPSQDDEPDQYASFAPRSRSTITAEVNATSKEPAGKLFSVSIEFLNLAGSRVSRFSAGLSNIEAP